LIDGFHYSEEPLDKVRFTAEFDNFYTRIARGYELAIKLFPPWRNWISSVLPHILGPRLLEVSFGTGYLFDQYHPKLNLSGIEYNREMIHLARRGIMNREPPISLMQGDVTCLPFQSGAFDTVVNTMAFSAYPDGQAAMLELSRVLRRGGRLLMVDINFPHDGNWCGVFLTRVWMKLGDMIRPMLPLFHNAGLEFNDQEIGGWGSVHLYMATKM
jgi:ubiquinone/menaquinone biosynthesis C-methylase UbiE